VAILVAASSRLRGALISFVVDAVVVVVFVAIGRSAHRHGVNASGMASTLWPFIVGLVAGSLTVAMRHLRPTSFRATVVIVALTVTVGMVLRVISGQGTAFAFILVAIGFLGAVMAAWRLAYETMNRRRSTVPLS
jgi:hypothetical protein